MKHRLKRETVAMTIVFQIEYDSSVSGARGAVMKKIQPFFEKSGHSWVNGGWAIKQLNKRFIGGMDNDI